MRADRQTDRHRHVDRNTSHSYSGCRCTAPRYLAEELCYVADMPAWLVGVEFNAPPHSTQYRSFRRRSSQPITWLILTNETVRENTDKQTQYKSDKVDKLKYSRTKLPWFSCLLQHSARKRGGLILQRSRAHTGERSSPVVDLQSAGCPTVTPCYCWRPFICHSSPAGFGTVFLTMSRLPHLY